MPAHRASLEATLSINGGELFDVTTTMRDVLELTKQQKKLQGGLEESLKLIWLACIRLGKFEGEFEAFVDAIGAEIEIGDAPPLRQGRDQ